MVRMATRFVMAVSLLGAITCWSSPACGEDVESGDDAEIVKKLDLVLENQKQIIQGLADLKGELQTVKIRVSQNQ